MKKVLSILLSFIMLFSITAGIDFSAQAGESWLWPVASSTNMSQGYSSGHDGLDITGAHNCSIRATMSGTVVYSYYGDIPNAYYGGGNFVVIKHSNGYYSHYAHLNSRSVSQGQTVKQGQEIGKMGSTGNSTGTHLHFAIATSQYGAGGRINNNPGVISYIYSIPGSSVNISFSEQSTNSVTNNSVGIHFVTNNPNSATITKFGIRIRKSGASSWTELIENQTFSMTYTKPYSNYVVGSGKELNYALTAGTTYEWQPLVVVNGSKIYDSKISSFKTTGSSDTTKVVISNVRLVSKSGNTFSMSCESRDNVGVASVIFCVYHPTKGWEEIKAVNNSNNTYSFTYPNADIDGEYTIHVHAYDAAGNYTNYTDYGTVTVDSHKIRADYLTIKLSNSSYTYDGKVKTPIVTVKDSNGKVISKSNYTIAYQIGRKNVGKYAVKITFKGNYSGSKILYFTIKPKATTLSSVKAKSKGFTVKWKKQATQTTGYQIQYSTSSKFTGAKTVTVSSSKTTSKKISKLKAKKKYYVRIRTYKTVKVNGKSTNIYSSWSKAKTVKTK